MAEPPLVGRGERFAMVCPVQSLRAVVALVFRCFFEIPRVILPVVGADQGQSAMVFPKRLRAPWPLYNQLIRTRLSEWKNRRVRYVSGIKECIGVITRSSVPVFQLNGAGLNCDAGSVRKFCCAAERRHTQVFKTASGDQS